MLNKNVKYFTTGEFAKICKVNKQTLIYYDQIGLLSPIMKDSKDYRYYSLAQYDFFSVIELLKAVGMSLKDIQQYMAEKSPENFLELMHQQKEIVAKKRRELEMIENIIDVKIKTTEEALHLHFDDITIEYFPEDTLYLSKNIEDSTEEQFVKAVSDFIEELDRSQLDTGYPIGGITRREQVLAGNYDNYSYLYIEQPNPREGHPYFKAIEGEFVIGYHVGPSAKLGETYTRLFNVMHEKGYELGQYVYEEYVYDAVIKNREEEYVTKIMMEVKKVK
ncbi:MAG TPA: MerR family DNA-binding transcriptional regulator [Lysinibacillus sp.]|uniref:Transcriptional regulator n=1 Tax=Lysinibacillus fusiformis TaxID=28031 RepID=A0A2I0UUQ8_9BACI|nr:MULTISPECIES: MerR family transcriptional regulator [Lysinibacillus]HBT72777.1 MerR family DNA-binding transcriptional regulator [Lysinibacillus sp.]KUF27795.1 transcriptional regulator [Lysinibacillus sp. F5]MEE3808023.1 MerR family transcriptional regulator [Lysinibacillus fusiformis]PKU49783.1 transcriptional regulator [Lysinibacillus fusiformis]WCH47584.1 MerR family transcriptional regulator [Lysinibacillus sp. OF-1]